jgi:hypothetical protein
VSNLASPLRLNLFTDRDLTKWLYDPMETPPLLPAVEQLTLALTGLGQAGASQTPNIHRKRPIWLLQIACFQWLSPPACPVLDSSGIWHETLPENAIAVEAFHAVDNAVAAFRAEETSRLGMTKTRDADLLSLFAFLDRLELDRNDGRTRGRTFLDLMRGLYRESPDGVSDSSSVGLV